MESRWAGILHSGWQRLDAPLIGLPAMPIHGPVPDWLFSGSIAITLWVVMFHLGLTVASREFRSELTHPGRLLKGLFAVLIVVPALALAVAKNLDLGRAAEIGIVLMSISPGAPLALHRSINAGGKRSYATVLQIMVSLLVVFSMPTWLWALDKVYDGHAEIVPWQLTKQVFLAQLLPLCIGISLHQAAPRAAEWLNPRLAPLATGLLLILIPLTIFNIWDVVIGEHWRVIVAVAVITVLALTLGHLLGGPEPATRTATAIASAARNPGLALLVASLNGAKPEVIAAVLAYFIISAITALPYAIWRRQISRSLDPD